MSKIIISTVKSPQDNSKLKKDSKGYYYITLGAVNAFNSTGEFYDIEGVNDLITNESSSLYRRLKSGALKGEVGHPEYTPGTPKAAFYSRNMKILLSNTSHHIRDIELVPTSKDSGLSGKGKYTLIKAWVKPSGPHGDALKAALENPDENVAFSIRCFTMNVKVNGVLVKKITQIITWDWVNEPGMSDATKWKELGIESLDLCDIDLEDIGDVDTINECFNCSLESNDEREITLELISKAGKYNKGKTLLDMM